MEVGKQYSPFCMFNGAMIPFSILSLTCITAADKLVFARLTAYAGSNGEAYPKVETLAETVGLSRSATLRSLKRLEEEGFIVRVKPTGKDRLLHKPDKYAFLWHKSLDESVNRRRSQNETSGDRQEETAGGLKMTPLKEVGSGLKGSGLKEVTPSIPLAGENDEDETLTDHTDEEKRKQKAQLNAKVREVQEHLVETVGLERFFYKAECNRENIRARLKDGATVEECKAVIDLKAEQWLGTDMAKYVNVQTLFRPKNFPRYLVESEINKPQQHWSDRLVQ